MPYIRSFRILGLAGRANVCEANFNEYVNVCYGFNGSGKTSLLRILHSALSNNGDLLKHVPFIEAEVVIYAYAIKTELTYSIKKTDETTEDTPALFQKVDDELLIASPQSQRKKKLQWSISPAQKNSSGAWSHKYLPVTRLYAPPRLSLASLNQGDVSEEAVDAQFAESLKRLWKDYSAQVARAVNKAQEAGLAAILEGVISRSKSKMTEESPDAAEAYESVQKFLSRRGMESARLTQKEFIRRYKRENQLRKVAIDIQQVERRISEETAPTRDLEKLVNELFLGHKQATFSDDDIGISIGGKAIGLSTLSSGEKQLLRILVDTLITRAGIILIDEPEISMHIDWQRRLISSMRLLNPHAQMIFATHSPEIMADIPDDMIFRI